MRSALGASRFQIWKHFLADGILLGGLGSVSAVGVSYFVGMPLVSALVPPELPRAAAVAFDAGVLGFTVSLGLLAVMISGMLPAVLLTSRRSLTRSLNKGFLRGAPAINVMHTALVVMQVALSLVLLVGAGGLVKSFIKLQNLERGIRPENVIAVRLTVPQNKYPQPVELVSHLDQILEALRLLNGVHSAAAINELPATGYINWGAQFTVDGRPAPPPGQEAICQVRVVGPDYFRTMGIELLQGRDFSRDDRLDDPTIVAVNETLAAQYFPGEEAIGKLLQVLRKRRSATTRRP